MGIAPGMNTTMWNQAALQRNVQRLREDGMYVIEPALIFSAAALIHAGTPMYGGLGTFWRGALGVMQTLVAIMNHHRLNNAQTRGQEPMLQAPGNQYRAEQGTGAAPNSFRSCVAPAIGRGSPPAFGASKLVALNRTAHTCIIFPTYVSARSHSEVSYEKFA